MDTLKTLARSALAGWVSLAVVWGAYIFIPPRNPAAFTPLGTSGAFVVFGLVYSFFYALNFLLFAVPYFLLTQKRIRPNKWLQTICGAVLFGVSVPLWQLASRNTNHIETVLLLPLAVIVGGITFSTLKPVYKPILA